MKKPDAICAGLNEAGFLPSGASNKFFQSIRVADGVLTGHQVLKSVKKLI